MGASKMPNRPPRFRGSWMPKPKPRKRPSAAQRGYDRKWAKAKKGYLMTHPLCVYCEQAGKTRVAKCVDHIVPHKGNQALFWDVTNWAASCLRCNSRKGDRPVEQFVKELSHG